MANRFATAAVAAVAVAGAVLSLPAAAHTSVGVQIGAPVYVHPGPVHVPPSPIYVRPGPVFVHPAPVYVQPPPVWHARPHSTWAPGYYDGYDRYDHRRGAYGWRDRDHDGVPNRWDRAPRNPYRH